MRTFTVTREHKLVGHAFASVWDTSVGKQYRFSFIISSDLNSGTVGWVTQLVVDMEVCKCWIATQLLQTFKNDKLFANVTAMGLVSSHPAACTALAKYAGKFYILIIVSPSLINSLGVKIENIDLSFCRNNAKAIIEASPVDYVRGMQLRGSLFENLVQVGVIAEPGATSTVYTAFFVDHNEPLAALKNFKDSGKWSLGELLEGHEFLIILPVA